MVPSKLSQLDQPIQQGMPWLSDYVLVSTAPNTGRQMQQATENQDWSATNLRSSTQGDSGKSASAAGASFSRSESLMLCLLHCCLGSLLRNSKNATYQYYGFLLHSYWMGQSRASKLASIDASSTEPLHLTANASIKSLQNTPTSGGTARAWQQIRQQITGPRMIMMRNGCNVVLYRALLPSAATSFVNTSRYFHSVPTQHRFQPSCSPSEDIHPTSAKQPLFVAVKARKYIQGLGIRPQGDPLKAGPQLIKRA